MNYCIETSAKSTSYHRGLTIAISLGCLTSTLVFADPNAKRATVTVQAQKSALAGAVQVQFKTTAGDGLKINADGPWKLEIKGATGLKFEKTEFKRDTWKENIAGFEVPAKLDSTTTKSGDVKYKLTTFVCTIDKSMCYREVVEGNSKVSL
jgi:hypothetical protein